MPKKEIPRLRQTTIRRRKRGWRKYPHQACLFHLHIAASAQERWDQIVGFRTELFRSTSRETGEGIYEAFGVFNNGASPSRSCISCVLVLVNRTKAFITVAMNRKRVAMVVFECKTSIYESISN